jgi:hypothetical protein
VIEDFRNLIIEAFSLDREEPFLFYSRRQQSIINIVSQDDCMAEDKAK